MGIKAREEGIQGKKECDKIEAMNIEKLLMFGCTKKDNSWGKMAVGRGCGTQNFFLNGKD